MCETDKKEAHLRALLRGYGKLAVAYSGGTDSTFLAAVAQQELGDDLLLVNAVSPSFPADERAFVEAFAAARRIRLLTVQTAELEQSQYAENPPTRCYFCRAEMYGKMFPLIAEAGFSRLADGANADDRGDYRPGQRAAAEWEVLHPLLEAELTKAEIREISRRLALPTWDKPAFACLASRLPYGERITPEKLARVEAAEKWLREEGFRVYRCRSHGPLARLEFGAAELPRAFARHAELAAKLKSLGFTYVTIDLEGFRSGSMNEVLGVTRLAE